MNPQPLISVRDVEKSSQWYQATLGFESGHGGTEYEQLVCAEKMVMQLHLWDEHEHPYLGDSSNSSVGNGVAIWFQTDDFDGALERIYSSKATILEGPMINENAQHREIWMHDPDGYVVVVAGSYGDLG